MKESIVHRGIIACPTLDDLFRQLNGVKAPAAPYSHAPTSTLTSSSLPSPTLTLTLAPHPNTSS
eukprot:303089-Prymnesium_polylepis.1